MKFQGQVVGFKELEQVLRQLPPALAKRSTVRALRAGSNVIKNEIKARAPRGDQPPHPKYGKLAESIQISTRKFTRSSAEVAIHTGAAFWGRFVEFGTKARKGVKKVMFSVRQNQFFGREVAGVTPKPFFTPGLDAGAPKAFQTMGEKLGDELLKVSSELAGKYGSIKKSTKRTF